MNIILNGDAASVRGPTLADALAELGYEGRFATAVNEEFVPAGARASHPISDGDRVEVLTPKQGG